MTTATTIQSVELEKFLGFATCIIRTVGYVKSTEAREKGIESTGDLAWEWATTGRPDSLRSVILLPEDKANGKIVAEWMENLETKGNEYLEHLFAIGVAKVVTERFKGYAASAIQAMERELKKERENNPKNPANAEKFLGTVGEKISLSLKFVGQSQFDSRYGICYKYIFSDGSDRKISWMTSTKLNYVSQGNVYTVKGTVKKHSSYRGSFETEITRATVLSG